MMLFIRGWVIKISPRHLVTGDSLTPNQIDVDGLVARQRRSGDLCLRTSSGRGENSGLKSTDHDTPREEPCSSTR